MLQLVSAAVRGKAESFKAEERDGDSYFCFDGQPLTGADLESLMGQLFESFTSQRLRDLAVALSAAFQTTDQDLTVKVSDGTYLFDGESFSQLSEEGDSEFTWLQVPGKFQLFGKLFKRKATLVDTLSLAAQAPLELEINGKRKGNSFYPPLSYTIVSTLEWQNPDFPFDSGVSYIKPHFQAACPHNFSALLILGGKEASSQLGLRVVLAGVPYQVKNPFDKPFVSGVLFTDSLQTDLSCSNIVQNAEFLAVVDLLNKQAHQMLHKTVTGPRRFTKSVRDLESIIVAELMSVGDTEEGDYAHWLDMVRAFHRCKGDPQILSACDEDLSPELREDFRLLATEAIIEKFQRSYNNRDLLKLMPFIGQLDGLLRELPQTERTLAMRDLVRVADPLQAVEETVESQSTLAQLRLHGRTEEALELSQRVYFSSQTNDLRPRADLHIAMGDYQGALDYLLECVFSDNLGQALETSMDFHRLELDLIADCLEYQKNPLSLEFRERAYEMTDSEDLKYLRCLALARQARASSELATWVKFQARAGFLWMGEARTVWDRLDRKVPRGREIIEKGRALPKDLDQFVLPLRDAFSHYQQLFPYFLTRLAHDMRMSGRFDEAERLLARAFSISEMDRLLGQL